MAKALRIHETGGPNLTAVLAAPARFERADQRHRQHEVPRSVWVGNFTPLHRVAPMLHAECTYRGDCIPLSGRVMLLNGLSYGVCP